MIERVGHIKNPLTVIAVFAGLAEVSGTVVLPFLALETQRSYVWFLMFFPCLLVLLFFAVLFFKHVVLYAPSDFRDDEQFTKFFRPVAPDVRFEKLENEIAADEANNAGEEGSLPVEEPFIPRPTDPVQTVGVVSVDAARNRALIAEELVIARLSRELNLSFQRNVSPSGMPRLAFDAVSTSEKSLTVLEIKYSRQGNIQVPLLHNTFRRFLNYFQSLPEDRQALFKLIFTMVVDSEDVGTLNKVRSKLHSISREYPFHVTCFVFSFTKLEEEITNAFATNHAQWSRSGA